MATPALAEFGSDSLRSEFLAPSIAGDLVACIAVSEPEAGSDVAGRLGVCARKHQQQPVTTSKQESRVHRTANLKKLGMHCSDTAEIFFDNVRVPAHHIIGEEGQGFYYQMLQFQDERLVAAAVLLEPIQRCITLTANYAAERKIFGSTVLNQQTVQFTLAELQSELEAVRSLLYRYTFYFTLRTTFFAEMEITARF
ncbi:hypothetical protein KIN20_012115 [Parelaphostrongylus tenuis]|uniref:Acyl-CoA dehydrogenase/oxidase C-terminal domain-containing protein n=1 Tax=Parelaphostrongylus tenuis TaxID=148309 RepID=A0AAD5MAF2_PARTN|nr:hypothetical protein KIN20_012115 [Parelaphostrongylus tenuis]